MRGLLPLFRDGSSPSPAKEEWVNAIESVVVEISCVLGKATMPVNQLLKMGRGAVIELDTNQNDGVTIFANNQPIARGEIVVRGDRIAVSIADMIRTHENDV